jgi:hypothetical protein
MRQFLAIRFVLLSGFTASQVDAHSELFTASPVYAFSSLRFAALSGFTASQVDGLKACLRFAV